MARRFHNAEPTESERIAALPVHKSAPPSAFEAVRRLTIRPGSSFRYEDTLQGRCQIAALATLYHFGGLLGLIGVGYGKTLIAILAATVLGARRPVYACPPGLVDQWHAERAKWARDLVVPEDVAVLPYSILQTPAHADALEELDPDLFIGDEAHNLRRPGSARSGRVIDALEARPGCSAVFLSGTLTANTLADYAHLGAFALGELSPLPRGGRELASWCAVIDPEGDPQRGDYRTIAPLLEAWAPTSRRPETFKERREEARDAYRERLVYCPGVIATKASAIGCSLEITRHFAPHTPEALLELAAETRDTLRMPGREELFDTEEDAIRCSSQLSFGFWYEWSWPASITLEEREAWRAARADWARFVRHELQDRKASGYDSPHLVARTVADERFEGADEWHHRALASWALWRKRLSDRLKAAGGTADKPPTRTHWIDRFLPRAAVAFARAHREPVAVWYGYRAIGEALEAEGLPRFGPGNPPPLGWAEDCAISIRAWHQGRQLEAWSRAYVTDWPASGLIAEQLQGRHHRPGQRADTVRFHVWQGSAAAQRRWRDCVEDATYIERTTRQRQKLGFAVVLTSSASGDAEATPRATPGRARIHSPGLVRRDHGSQSLR